MPDREKVIKWLNICKTSHYAVGIKEDYPCRLCPYYEKEYCMKQLITDALALLKEQEAVEPKRIPWLHSDGSESEKYRCGSCDLTIFQSYKFCPFCGRKVKWDA